MVEASRFRTALNLLEAEYDREVCSLRKEIVQLREIVAANSWVGAIESAEPAEDVIPAEALRAADIRAFEKGVTLGFQDGICLGQPAAPLATCASKASNADVLAGFDYNGSSNHQVVPTGRLRGPDSQLTALTSETEKSADQALANKDTFESENSFAQNDNNVVAFDMLDDNVFEETLAPDYVMALLNILDPRITKLVLAKLAWWNALEEPPRTGCLTLIEDSNHFQSLCYLVIFCNIVYIGVVADLDIRRVLENPKDHASSLTGWRLWFEIGFTIFYSMELLLGWCIHRLYFYTRHGWRWNLFDTVLVVGSVMDMLASNVSLVESGNGVNFTFLRALRSLKFARLMRVVRGVEWVRELCHMLDCVLNSASQLFWCLSLISIVLMLFSLLLVQGVTERMAEFGEQTDRFLDQKLALQGSFDSIPNTILSLFMATTGGQSWIEQYVVVKEAAGPLYQVCYLFYISFFAIVAWNIVLSSFVEKAFKLAVPEFELMSMEKRATDIKYAKELTAIIVSKFDADHNGALNLDEFKDIVNDHELRAYFLARDLDIKDIDVFFNMLASHEHSTEVNINTFVLGCMRLRGMASTIDVVTSHFDMKNMHVHHTHHLRKLEAAISELSNFMRVPVAPTLEIAALSVLPEQSGAVSVVDEKLPDDQPEDTILTI